MKYQNPILPGFYPDPTICRVGSDYFLATSSFEYFPGVPLFHSTDLIHWEQIGHCLTRKSQLDLTGIQSSEGIFAPTLRYHNGTFYMITTVVGGRGHFYVTTDNPYGEWSDPIFVEGDGFDPDLFFDDDGKVYVTRQNPHREGIIQFEIDITTGKLLDSGTILWRGFQDIQCEGPHIYRKDGWYYLLTAEGGTHKGHMVTIARSRNVSGPYEGCPDNPILSHRGCPDQPIQATGHGDLIEHTDGSWWIVFLGIRQVGDWLRGVGHHLGRETYLAPVQWIDGWPVVHGGNPITEVMECDNRQSDSTVEVGYRDNFDLPVLSPRWNFRGNPKDGFYTLEKHPPRVILHCSVDTLKNPHCGGFMGVRQQHVFCIAATEIELSSDSFSGEAGIVACMNERHYYALGVRESTGGYELFLRKQVGSLETETTIPLEGSRVELRIGATEEEYRFSYVDTSGNECTIGTGETHYLTSEVAGGFTGVYFGLFATGAHVTDTSHSGDSSSVTVHWFSYNIDEKREQGNS